MTGAVGSWIAWLSGAGRNGSRPRAIPHAGLSARPNDAPTILGVGAWTVDSGSCEIRNGSASHHLGPQQLALLLHLVERPGRVVEKEELFQSIWHGVAVEEVALPRCISELRKLLGDDARQPVYIETVPRRGYRLIADVCRPSQGAAADVSLRGAGLWGLLVLGAGLVVACLSVRKLARR